MFCLHTYRCLFRLHSPSLCHHLYLVSFGNEHLLVTAQTSRGCGTRAAFSMLSLEDGSCRMVGPRGIDQVSNGYEEDVLAKHRHRRAGMTLCPNRQPGARMPMTVLRAHIQGQQIHGAA